MLTTSDNLLLSQLLGEGIQYKLFHHLSRDGGKADWPVLSQIILLALFEDWSDIGYHPVFRHLSHSPRPPKDDREQFSNRLFQLPQHMWTPSRPMDLCTLMLPRCSWTISSLTKGKLSIPQTLTCLQGPQFPKGSLCSEDRSKEGVLHLRLLSISQVRYILFLVSFNR